MIKKLPLKYILTTMVFVIGVLTVSAQISLREISLKEQIENSSLVIEGKVIAKKSFWDADHRLIYTANTVEVYKVFKGEPVSFIEVITIGGTVGLKALLVSNSLKLHEGSLGVFTLYDSNVSLNSKNFIKNKQFRAYSSLQGFYKYDLYNDKAINAFRRRKGIISSFYNDIMRVTNLNYKEILSFNVLSAHKKYSQKNNSLAPTNITFAPTIIRLELNLS